MKVKTKIKGRMYETTFGRRYTKYAVYYRRGWGLWRPVCLTCLLPNDYEYRAIAEWNTREEAEEVANNIENYI